MSRFNYIIDKLMAAPKSTEPFEHILIQDLFSEEDFAEICACPQNRLGVASDDADLFGKLQDASYKVISFPGCIVEQDRYLEWHRTKAHDPQHTHSACEGFGMTLRLTDPRTPIMQELNAFFTGRAFNEAVANRFGVSLDDCTTDGGIQKYLDGYEISPHPDIRRKAATFMININSVPESENLHHHTQYLRFKPEYQYVQQFWEKQDHCERCWVPWDWCDTDYSQTQNNSIVLFSPDCNTMHAVRAEYDHLPGQRTQIYGNLWYTDRPKLRRVEWEALANGPRQARKAAAPLATFAKKLLPAPIFDMARKLKGGQGTAKSFSKGNAADGSVHKRNY